MRTTAADEERPQARPVPLAGLGVTTVSGLAVPMLPPSLAVVRIDHPAAVRTTVMVRRADAPPDPHRQAIAETLRDAGAQIAVEVRRHLAS
jgi:DNA-binding transcriptional LysR family regulator